MTGWRNGTAESRDGQAGRRGAALLALLPLAACTVGPDYVPATPAALGVPGRFASAAPAPSPAAAPPLAQGAAGEADADLATWWQRFGDPVLADLVRRGQANNLDVAVAGARLAQARATLRQVQGTARPTLDASGSVARSVGADSRSIIDPTTGQTLTSGGDSTVYRAGLTAAWEADVFGGIRRSIQAARADAEAQAANLHFAQLTVAADAGQYYVQARLAQKRLGIARANLAAQEETVQIVGWRVQAGLVSALDLEQARQLRAQTAASIPTLENGYVSAVNRIAVLLGEAPGAVSALLASGGEIPLAPAVRDPIPAAIVQRRPDIAAAERALAAETARIGVAQAELYPALRLTGTLAGSATSLGDLASAALGNLAGAISAPIFRGGQLRAAVEGQRAATAAAFGSYRSAVLTALEEVDNALSGLSTAERREAELTAAAEAANNAVIYARAQYRAGLIDFQSLLDSERTLLSSQDSAASARGDRATATVALYRALGGGWQAAPLPATALTSTGAADADRALTRP